MMNARPGRYRKVCRRRKMLFTETGIYIRNGVCKDTNLESRSLTKPPAKAVKVFVRN